MPVKDVLVAGTVRKIQISQLKRDPRVNRSLRSAHANTITGAFDPNAIGVLVVWERENGEFVILDGQHRHQAMLDHGLGSQYVYCRVLRGLSLQQAAALFRVLNNTRRPRAIDDFLKGLVAEDSACVDIAKILEDSGWHVSEQLSQDGGVACVDALRRVYFGRASGYAKAGADEAKPELLRRTVETITKAWGHQPGAMNGQLVHGLGIVYLAYNGEINHDDLARKLAKFPGGPDALVGQAKGLKNVRGGSVVRSVAASVIGVYNKGKSGRRLREP